jgi:Family of unknown function (DUF6178)
MATSPPFLDRLLNTPDLAKAVPYLQPEVLHRVVQMCGLEDSAEFVALATPAQLARILDLDLWRVRTPGADEEFDVDRFGVWLAVLMQSGAPVAAEKLSGLDMDLVVAGFSRHAAVFDYAALSSFTSLDGDLVPGRMSNRAPTAEIGGYVIKARRMSAWDTIPDLLAFLHAEHSEYFQRLMRGCVRLSNGPREADGFHTLLHDAEQALFDLACDREARREQQGYVTPPQARAFLQASRHLQLDGARPAPHPIARAYFRALEPMPAAQRSASGRSAGLLPASRPAAITPPIEPAAMAGVVEILRDAGVLPEEPRALLSSAAGEHSRLALIQDHVASHPASTPQLAYLANAIVAGCSIQGRPFTPREASEAAAAICNLGLENWPPHWNECDPVAAFQVGWTVLHRDVSMYAAERLLDVIAAIRCGDRDIQLRLHGLRRELMQSVRDAAPWRARNALDVIVMLDPPSWAALLALIDECPVLHGAITAARDRRRAIDPSDCQFISQNSDIGVVREFMTSLGARLTQ